jgi:hypothetical protein
MEYVSRDVSRDPKRALAFQYPIIALIDNLALAEYIPVVAASDPGPGSDNATGDRFKVIGCEPGCGETASRRQQALDCHDEARVGQAEQCSPVHQSESLGKLSRKWHAQNGITVFCFADL